MRRHLYPQKEETGLMLDVPRFGHEAARAGHFQIWLGRIAAAICLVFTVLCSATAQPKAGALDSTFAPVVSVPGGSVFSILVQPDGKTLVRGRFTSVSGILNNGLVR